MTSKLVEVGQKRTLTCTGFDYLAAHIGGAKIKRNTFYSTIEWFNTQVYKKSSKKNLGTYVVIYIWPTQLFDSS